VVDVSEPYCRLSLDELENPICDICGFEIEERGQQCFARDDGEVCAS
jgi:hypothetical protein